MMGIPPKKYNGHINPLYTVDDHPYHWNFTLDPRNMHESKGRFVSVTFFSGFFVLFLASAGCGLNNGSHGISAFLERQTSGQLMVGGSWWFLDVQDPPYENGLLQIRGSPGIPNHRAPNHRFWKPLVSLVEVGILGLYLEDGLPGLVRIAGITPIHKPRSSAIWKGFNNLILRGGKLTVVIYLVVSNIFYLNPYLGKWSNLTNIFQMGWNHQLVMNLWTACKSWDDTPTTIPS